MAVEHRCFNCGHLKVKHRITDGNCVQCNCRKFVKPPSTARLSFELSQTKHKGES
jgi:predicted  nucleic acid-binding Zn-ribbon protein